MSNEVFLYIYKGTFLLFVLDLCKFRLSSRILPLIYSVLKMKLSI